MNYDCCTLEDRCYDDVAVSISAGGDDCYTSILQRYVFCPLPALCIQFLTLSTSLTLLVSVNDISTVLYCSYEQGMYSVSGIVIYIFFHTPHCRPAKLQTTCYSWLGTHSLTCCPHPPARPPPHPQQFPPSHTLMVDDSYTSVFISLYFVLSVLTSCYVLFSLSLYFMHDVRGLSE